jgi:hypothetical protein
MAVDVDAAGPSPAAAPPPADGEEATGAHRNDQQNGSASAVPLLVMPDLIAELVDNGSIAPHIRRLMLAAHVNTWRDRRGVAPELEVGSVVATVDPAPVPPPPADAATSSAAAPPAAGVPFLLRAFRRAAPVTAAAPAPAPVVVHCATGPHPIDDWAPPSLLHVVKALRAGGLPLLHGPGVWIQPTDTVNVSVAGQRYTVSRRHRLCLSAPAAVVNLKCKYQIPVNYPGQAADSLHIALESESEEEEDGDSGRPTADLLDDARSRGILPARGPVMGASAVHRNTYAKCEWTSGRAHPLFEVIVRLQFVLPDTGALPVAAVRAAVLAAPRPRGPTDVAAWLRAVGCVPGCPAEWRVEIEMTPPFSSAGLTQGLFLHHLIRQTVQPTGLCVTRTAFTELCAQHLFPPVAGVVPDARTAADAAYGRALLAEFCRFLGLPLDECTGYPRQPRPYDLVGRYLDRLAGCVATPKADGTEAFLIGHAYGVTLLVRTGVVRCFPWRRAAAAVYPFVLEGETFGTDLFVAYDCLLSPVARYTAQGRYATRHAAMEAVLLRLADRIAPALLAVRSKPAFAVATHPHAAIRGCVEWSRRVGLPCDGIVFVDDTLPGYNRTERLWKLKDSPTVDFVAFCAGPALPGIYEIMLRGPKGLLQSLHRFRHAGSEYVAPVLIRPPPEAAIADGKVVELTCRTERVTHPDPAAAARHLVTYPTLACRETGKAANFLVGGMDIMANGLSVDALLRPNDPVLVRLLVKGPLRRARDGFMRSALRTAAARAVLEIGGGRGGDCGVWMAAESVRRVEVVEPDADAVAEYRSRLCRTFGAVNDPAAPPDCVLPDGRRFRFHVVPFFGLDPAVGRGCDLAVLSFSVSQIVGGPADLDALLCGLLAARDIPYVAIAAHDHVHAGLSSADGVVCRRTEVTGCERHRLFCTCDHRREATRTAAILSTTVYGTLMANGIREYAFGAAYLERAVRRLRAAGRLPATAVARVIRPFPREEFHWLLRSLAFVLVVSGPPRS